MFIFRNSPQNALPRIPVHTHSAYTWAYAHDSERQAASFEQKKCDWRKKGMRRRLRCGFHLWVSHKRQEGTKRETILGWLPWQHNKQEDMNVSIAMPSVCKDKYHVPQSSFTVKATSVYFVAHSLNLVLQGGVLLNLVFLQHIQNAGTPSTGLILPLLQRCTVRVTNFLVTVGQSFQQTDSLNSTTFMPQVTACARRATDHLFFPPLKLHKQHHAPNVYPSCSACCGTIKHKSQTKCVLGVP